MDEERVVDDGDETYFLEQVTLDDDDDDDYEYKEVEVDEDLEEELVGDDGDEDLEQALKTLKTKDVSATPKEDIAPRPEISRRPEVLDDFIRNVLLKLGMTDTLDMFQREWYRLSGEGKLSDIDMGTVPDIYVRNQQLGDQLKNMQVEITKMEEVSTAAKSTWDKFRKERDFHKMHHKRVVQEKNKLIVDLKRLKTHYENYEPMLKMMRAKYETAMKEKMLMKLERDRLSSKVGALEAQLRQLEATTRPAEESSTEIKGAGKRTIRVAKMPDERDNPYLTKQLEAPPVERWGLSKTFQTHTMAVSCVAMHPKNAVVATGSDDGSWKMWSLPSGELIMSGEGHDDWIACVDFHPQGALLATGSADSTVKVWDFQTSRCVASLAEHTSTVWGVTYHHTGDFLVSASMDHTAKLWDLVANKAKNTFRGHVDSVNAAVFQPYSNNVATASGDKTVSLWDCRSGLCIQTLYGHKNAINSLAFSMKGDMIASADADGAVRLWDVRMVSEIACAVAGPAGGAHPCNSVAFDPSGQRLAAGSDDGLVRVFDSGSAAATKELKLLQQMTGHNDAVQCVAFDRKGGFLCSGGSDTTLRTWC